MRILQQANDAPPPPGAVMPRVPAQAGEPWGGTGGMDPESNALREQPAPPACDGVVDYFRKKIDNADYLYDGIQRIAQILSDELLNEPGPRLQFWNGLKYPTGRSLV